MEAEIKHKAEGKKKKKNLIHYGFHIIIWFYFNISNESPLHISSLFFIKL